jgi:hypothetical protein
MPTGTDGAVRSDRLTPAIEPAGRVSRGSDQVIHRIGVARTASGSPESAAVKVRCAFSGCRLAANPASATSEELVGAAQTVADDIEHLLAEAAGDA